MKYRHIVFDVDGTLIDSEEAMLLSLQQVLERQTGQQVPLEALTFTFGITGQEALRRLRVADPDAVLKQWDEAYCALELPVQMFDGVEDMLHALKKAGSTLGIVTSQSREEFELFVAKRFPALPAFFSHIVCSNNTTRHKPQPDPLLYYITQAGAQNRQVLYVGDSVYDAQCAERAGVDFGLAVWGAKTKAGRKANYYFASPQEVVELLAGHAKVAVSNT